MKEAKNEIKEMVQPKKEGKELSDSKLHSKDSDNIKKPHPSLLDKPKEEIKSSDPSKTTDSNLTTDEKKLTKKKGAMKKKRIMMIAKKDNGSDASKSKSKQKEDSSSEESEDENDYPFDNIRKCNIV